MRPGLPGLSVASGQHGEQALYEYALCAHVPVLCAGNWSENRYRCPVLFFECMCHQRDICIFCPRLMPSAEEFDSPEFHATRRLNLLWRTCLEKCRQDFCGDLQKANTDAEMLSFMISKDLFESPQEGQRKVGDKQAMVDPFDKEFKEATEEFTTLIARARQLSFKPEKSQKKRFHRAFQELTQEMMEIVQFRD
jgi:hypothetical protein